MKNNKISWNTNHSDTSTGVDLSRSEALQRLRVSLKTQVDRCSPAIWIMVGREAMKSIKYITILFVLMAAGCANEAPVEEVRIFGTAFETLNAASQPLIDDLAVAEREQGKRIAIKRAKQNAKGTPK